VGLWIQGFLWKDVRLFVADRQAVVMSFIVPILIASILGWLDSSASDSGPPKHMPVIVVDQDSSEISHAVIDRLKKDPRLAISEFPLATAKTKVRDELVSSALILPSGFGATASQAFKFGIKAKATLLSDPSKPTDGQIVMGIFMEDASQTVVQATYGALAGAGTAPVSIVEQAGSDKAVAWGRAAHDYAGFGLQGLLFFAVESAVGLARERRQGIWKRLRASPVSLSTFVLSRAFSSTVLAFAIILCVFAVGALLFGIRLLGSALGFLLIALATATMAATFGLLFATVGKSESQSRGLGVLAILVMLATGGAWFPLERMPGWVQTTAQYLPVRWAVGGFDGVTWRGYGLSESLKTSGVLLVFSLVFAVFAVLRFRVSRELT
jgi:ABC-2 type transport system permease protein